MKLKFISFKPRKPILKCRINPSDVDNSFHERLPTPSSEWMKYTFQFLTEKELGRLSTVSSLFKKNVTVDYRWKLISAGLDVSLATQIHKTGSIVNYSNLYQTWMRIDSKYRQKYDSLWELLCLSGEEKAIDYAITRKLIDPEKINHWGENALHLVAFSGSVLAMHRMTQIPEFDLLSVTYCKSNLLHMAIQSGRVSMMEWAAQIPTLDLLASTNDGFHAGHWAAFTDSIEAIDFVAKIPGLDLTAVTRLGFNILHLAMENGSQITLERIAQIPGIDVTALTNYKHNMLHRAAYYGNIAGINWAAQLPGIDLEARSSTGKTALHLAVLNGQISAVLFLRKLYKKRGLDLDPKTLDDEKHDAYWYANQHTSDAIKTELKNALTAPIEEASPEEKMTVVRKLSMTG